MSVRATRFDDPFDRFVKEFRRRLDVEEDELDYMFLEGASINLARNDVRRAVRYRDEATYEYEEGR
jgi:hypothetical protein